MIPLYAAQAGTGNILQLDDPSVLTDLAAANGTGGTAYAPWLLSGFLHANGGSGYERFRRLVQRIPHDGAATLTVTPWVDGAPSGQAATTTVASTDQPTAVLHYALDGSVFQLELELSAFTQVVSLGSARAHSIVHRSQR